MKNFFLNSYQKITKFKQIKFIISLLLTCYLTLCLLFYWGQTRLIFFPPQPIEMTPKDFNIDYQNVYLETSQGKIHGWWIHNDQPQNLTVLYLHGNSSNVSDCVHRIARLYQLGFSILIIDYRGYGYSSPIFPNETRVYEDAEVALNYLTQTLQINSEDIILYGHSLGGAIAIELASKYPHLKGVIVESTFTSMQAMIKQTLPMNILPLNLLLTEKFDSLSKIKTQKLPILIIHGTNDQVIPVKMAEQLYQASTTSKQIKLIDQANHNNVSSKNEKQYLQTIQQFLAKLNQMIAAVSNQ